ncbi:DUF4435 domain-containing protein [Pseudomonas monteilii]|uniref:DUF4435 domain-containing protein n=1 Tax=Pseudomonas monteilii TaxID=76759 RepID=UPI0030D03849
MSKLETRIREIKERQVGNSSKRVLLLEGGDDVQAFDVFLRKAHPDFERSWVLAQAGKKQNVIDILAQEPDWLGLVDRDEWSDEKIAEITQTTENLLFLPRYCIENYLILPRELWNALPEKQQNKITGGFPQLEQVVMQDLDRWVSHGVLWSIVNPLWEGLRSLGFKEKLLDPAISFDHGEILKVLAEWHQFLEPNHIIQRFRDKLEMVVKLSPTEKLSRHVHGKKFYEAVIDTSLNRLLGQRSADDRQKAIIRFMSVPDDLDCVWARMGLR